jgi:hypothetical protein
MMRSSYTWKDPFQISSIPKHHYTTLSLVVLILLNYKLGYLSEEIANSYKIQLLTVSSCSIVLSIWHLREVGKLSDWNLRVLSFSKRIHRWCKGLKMLVGSNSSPPFKVMTNRYLWNFHRTSMVLKWRSEIC